MALAVGYGRRGDGEREAGEKEKVKVEDGREGGKGCDTWHLVGGDARKRLPAAGHSDNWTLRWRSLIHSLHHATSAVCLS